MSLSSMRSAMELALSGMVPAVVTAWENTPFTPPSASVPYQAAYLLPSEPENAEFGRSHTLRAVFQVSLFYPLQAGARDASLRAEMIQSLYRRGATFSHSGVSVVVDKTPEISRGTVDGDRWLQPVKIRISAYIP